MPAQKYKIKEFTKWVNDQFILGIDSTTLPFSQADASELLRRSKTHQLFVSKSDTISKAERSVKLTKQVKREYWESILMNYVREIPGRDGVPLK